MPKFFSIVAEAKDDMDVYIKAELIEMISAYLVTDVSVLWVTYGEMAHFNIYSNQNWIIHNE